MKQNVFPVYVTDRVGKSFELSAKTAVKIEFYHGVRRPVAAVLDVVQNPDFIFESNWASDHRLFYKGFNGNAFYIVVVADMAERRIDTAYVTKKVKQGRRIWPSL